MSCVKRGLTLGGAITGMVASCIMAIVCFISIILSIQAIAMISESGIYGSSGVYLDPAMYYVLVALLVVLLVMLILNIVYCSKLFAKPNSYEKEAKYRKTTIRAIVFDAICLVLCLVLCIFSIGIIELIVTVCLLAALVLLIVGHCVGNKYQSNYPVQPTEQYAVQQTAQNGQNYAAQNTNQEFTTLPLNNQERPVYVEDDMDKKIRYLRQLNQEGILSDEEMKKAIIEIIQK